MNETTLSPGPVNAPKAQDRMKVAMLSLPPRTQAVLEFFFASAGRSSFQAVDEAQADAAIFDQDHLESRQHWQRFNELRQRPGIALAVQEQEVTGAVWVHKPVTPAALLAAAARLRQSTAAAAPTPTPMVEEPRVTGSAADVSRSPVGPVPTPTVASTRVPVAAPLAKGPASGPVAAPAAPLIERVARVVTAPPPVSAVENHSESLAAPSTQQLIDPLLEEPRASAPPVRSEGAVPPGIHDGARPAARGLGSVLRRWLGGRGEPPAPTPNPRAVIAAPESPVPSAPSVAAVAPPSASEEASESLASRPVDRSTAQATTVLNPPVPASAARSTVQSDALVNPSGATSGLRPVPAAEMMDEPQLCGSREDIDPATLGTRHDLRYNLDAMLLSSLTEAYLVGAKWQVPTQVELSQGTLVVDTTQNVAYLDLDASRWADLLTRPMIRRPKTRAVSRQEFAEMSERWKDRVSVVRLDHLLWRSALETSVGRLPTGVNPGKTVYLKHWPNLTRLHQTPHGLRIAALWATRGASLLETATQLRVAQRHVFAFYNAAMALDLVTEDGAHVRRLQRKGTKNKGLLSKLFGWLQK